eukprot:364278-Chlamydomonas_euryale.AAC.4
MHVAASTGDRFHRSHGWSVEYTRPSTHEIPSVASSAGDPDAHPTANDRPVARHTIASAVGTENSPDASAQPHSIRRRTGAAKGVYGCGQHTLDPALRCRRRLSDPLLTARQLPEIASSYSQATKRKAAEELNRPQD